MAHAFIIESGLKDTAGVEYLHPAWDKEHQEVRDRTEDTHLSPERSASGGVSVQTSQSQLPISGKDTLAGLREKQTQVSARSPALAFQTSSAQNNQYARVSCLGVAHLQDLEYNTYILTSPNHSCVHHSIRQGFWSS